MQTETARMINLNDDPQANTQFAPEIFNDLPDPLRHGCNILTDQKEKEVFLMGALGVISGLLPNITGVYDGMKIAPNLYVYLIGAYGSGKGALRYARELGAVVHKERINATISDRERYDMELEDYNQKFKSYKKNPIGEPPVRPEEPGQYLKYIPANNSKSGFFELLNTNNGSGILFETEGDSLTDALKQDYGAYSDGLRKGYHHEPISFYRRQNKEFVEIESPKISVVLSSTFDQLLSLIPTAENGLFSRFCFYVLDNDPEFKNVFDESKGSYREAFRDMGETMHEIYKLLINEPDGIEYDLTEPQKERFTSFFKKIKLDVQQDISHNLDGTINRLGLQFFRISMILTVLRHCDNGGLFPKIYCSDQDFELTKQIITTLKHFAIKIYLDLPQPQLKHKAIDKANDIQKAHDLRQAGKSYGDISVIIFGNTLHKSTVYRWINY